MIKLPDIYPVEWESKLDIETLDYLPFRNLIHFKNYVSKITQEDDNNCNVSYKQAVTDLITGKSSFNNKIYTTIRNLVRSNLLKRGLLTQEVYENFKYGVDGTVVDYDVGKYAAGEPDCVITPGVEYIDFFYELYVNISYRSGISNETISKNMFKMLATIEELQRQHINIKITVVLPIKNVNNKNNFLATIPLYSHKEFKTASVMSSILNERLLRKFFFAVIEDKYGKDLAEGKGRELKLPKTMNLANTFNEVDFFTEIQTAVQGKNI